MEIEGFEVVSLDNCGELPLEHPTMKKAQRWITGMVPAQDKEEGELFWQWIVDHHYSRKSCDNPLYASFFLVEESTGRVVGTGSIVEDDQDLGKQYSLEGVWLGGFNIRQGYKGRYRSRALGHLLYHVIRSHIQQEVNRTGRPERINLFTTEVIAKRLVEAEGYTRDMVLAEYDNQVVCHRWFLPDSQ